MCLAAHTAHAHVNSLSHTHRIIPRHLAMDACPLSTHTRAIVAHTGIHGCNTCTAATTERVVCA